MLLCFEIMFMNWILLDQRTEGWLGMEEHTVCQFEQIQIFSVYPFG